MLFVNLSCYLIFAVLEWYNKKRYSLSLTNTNKYTLSERFQLQENIRTALLVKNFAIVLLLLNSAVGANFIASNYFVREDLKMISYFAFNYFFIFYGYIFAIVWNFRRGFKR